MKETPCISECCLMYPLCKNKMHIECDKLEEFFQSLLRDIHVHRSDVVYLDAAFDALMETLPKLFQIIGNGRMFSDIRQLNDTLKEEYR